MDPPLRDSVEFLLDVSCHVLTGHRVRQFGTPALQRCIRVTSHCWHSAAASAQGTKMCADVTALKMRAAAASERLIEVITRAPPTSTRQPYDVNMMSSVTH